MFLVIAQSCSGKLSPIAFYCRRFFFSFLKEKNVKLIIIKQTSYDAREGLQQILLPNNLHWYIAYSETKPKPLNCQLLLFLEKKATLERCSHNIPQTPKLLEIFPIDQKPLQKTPNIHNQSRTKKTIHFHSTKDKNQKREKRNNTNINRTKKHVPIRH